MTEFSNATTKQISAAAEAAQSAFHTYAQTSPEQRAQFLDAIADAVHEAPALLETAAQESALPMPRLEGERARTVGQLRMFASLLREGSWVDARIDRAQPERKPLPKPDLRRMLQPLGPVAVFGASNFPLAFSVAGGDTASALAAGNPVVVKAHPAHPATSEIAAQAIRDAASRCGLPEGVFSMVHGSSPEVSITLVQHPAIAAVGFTGSLKAGRALLDAAASRPDPIPVFAEMGSLNPMFLLPDALEQRGEAIAEGLMASVTLGVGQFCTKPGVVFAVRGAKLDAFKEHLAAKLQSVAAGTMLHVGIARAFHESCNNLQTFPELNAFAKGSPSGTDREAAAMGASVSYENFLKRPELAEEVFGPFVLLVECPDEASMLQAAGSLHGQLTATVHSDAPDSTPVQSLMQCLSHRAGRLILNGFPTGVEVCPSMHHGGPYPATTDARYTSVGTAAIFRFARPVSYQNFPQALLPDALKDNNPLGISRLVDGKLSTASL